MMTTSLSGPRVAAPKLSGEDVCGEDRLFIIGVLPDGEGFHFHGGELCEYLKRLSIKGFKPFETCTMLMGLPIFAIPRVHFVKPLRSFPMTVGGLNIRHHFMVVGFEDVSPVWPIRHLPLLTREGELSPPLQATELGKHLSAVINELRQRKLLSPAKQRRQ